MIDDKGIFVQAVQADSSLPVTVREEAATVQGFERRSFDLSYLDFLRSQIALEPRGPEWTAILVARLAALEPFCGVPTLSGFIPTPTGFWFVRVDPLRRLVIHHEEQTQPKTPNHALQPTAGAE